MKKATNTRRRNGSGLTYYLHDESAAFRFQLAGDLSQESVLDLDQACETASSTFRGRDVIVDLTGVSSIDTAGRELLDRWRKFDARFTVATSEAMARLEPVTGAPITFVETKSAGHEWLPVRIAALWLATLFVLVLAATAISADDDLSLGIISLQGGTSLYHARVSDRTPSLG